ncbi:DsrE family protein [Candidatus Haliotispira prima]|uniref:DsrE family protein n=1 Tax=Candidatus Haliotispira prima TaxID=3034016 RepID=A0ABY8MIU7_9SPIO|nr:DsrE family protein [Candidatus Haliotispira prima]
MKKKTVFIVGAVVLLSSLALSAASFVMMYKMNYEDDITKVVYHVSEPDRVQFALNNVKNHILGVEDSTKLKVVFVVHGPALKEFHSGNVKSEVSAIVRELEAHSVGFEACMNTMNAQKISTEELLSGFVRIDEGGVVRLAELQKQGYAYIRP